MKLYPHPKTGILWADIRHPVTNARMRVSTRTTDRRIALEAATMRLHALRVASGPQVADNMPIALSGALKLYSDSLIGRPSHGYTTRYASQLRAFFVDDPELHMVAPNMVQSLVSARMASGLSAQTITHEVGVLRSAMKYAAGLGYRTNPQMLVGDRKVWRLPSVTQKTRYLTPEELKRLFAYLDPDKLITRQSQGARKASVYHLRHNSALYQERRDVRDMVLFMVLTGARWGEVTGLTWGQISPSYHQVRIWGEKTNKERLVGASEPLKAMLRDRCPMHGRPPEAYLVFPGRDAKRRHPSSLAPALRALDAIGLNDKETVSRHGRATVHSLRHTYASLLLQNGAGIRDLQEALGHSKIATTQRYTHLEAGASAARLGGIMDGLTGSMGL